MSPPSAILISAWRMLQVGPLETDMAFYVDLSREHVRIYEGVDPDLEVCEVDKVVSVSALPDGDGDEFIQETLPLEEGLPF